MVFVWSIYQILLENCHAETSVIVVLTNQIYVKIVPASWSFFFLMQNYHAEKYPSWNYGADEPSDCSHWFDTSLYNATKCTIITNRNIHFKKSRAGQGKGAYPPAASSDWTMAMTLRTFKIASTCGKIFICIILFGAYFHFKKPAARSLAEDGIQIQRASGHDFRTNSVGSKQWIQSADDEGTAFDIGGECNITIIFLVLHL